MTMPSFHDDRRGSSRRSFLLGAALGLAAGVPLTWLAARRFAVLSTGHAPISPEESTARAGVKPGPMMPGRYPGRVIEARHADAVSTDNVIDLCAVSAMVGPGMAGRTGHDPGG